jgi:GNAT superfamily N-acetyltransferase/catechol 2,3-dioxygenase-like lactoylglutathione lyase family enzyme
MEQAEIREAAGDDLAAAIALLDAQLREHAIELAPDALARAVRGLVSNREFGRVFVARAAGRVAGVAVISFLWALEHGGAAAWLDELYVEPSARGRGLGRRLAETALAAARAAGCIAVDLETEPGHGAAERIYAGLGFRRHQRTRWWRPLAAAPAPVATSYSRDHRPFASLDHLSLGVGDLARAKAFYDAALAPLGLVAHQEIAGEIGYGSPEERGRAEGFAFYIGFEDPAAQRVVQPSAGFHLAFRAPTREAVRRFHAAGLAHGGSDLGAPGLRPRHHANYYGACLGDPDGHHVEAVCHAPVPGDDARRPDA